MSCNVCRGKLYVVKWTDDGQVLVKCDVCGGIRPPSKKRKDYHESDDVGGAKKKEKPIREEDPNQRKLF